MRHATDAGFRLYAPADRPDRWGQSEGKGEDKKLSFHIRVRVTQSAAEAIRRKALDDGLTESEWARKILEAALT